MTVSLSDQECPKETADVSGSLASPPPHDIVASDDFNPKHTFEQFVIGVTNRFAHAAALAVAELPSQAFNPLFIYGPPGLGKTHLLHAIGHYLQRNAPEMRVCYMTAESFTARFVRQLRDGDLSAFKSLVRGSEVLLIDDVQFLENKLRTEEEFFHTFNALYESGRQLVITCDRTPRELTALADRLRDRFESGLVTELGSPDERLRLTILRKRAAADGISIDDDALRVISERIPTNVRILEGALIRVAAYASLNTAQATVDLTRAVLDKLYPQTRHTRCTVDQIQGLVAARFGVTSEDLLSPSRTRGVAYPRHIAMYLACELTDETVPAIAKSFRRAHSTVIHAHDKIARRIDADPKTRDHTRAITGEVARADRLST